MAKRVLRGKGLIEIEIPYAGFSSGAGIAAEALKLARDWPERLDLASYGVQKRTRDGGDYALFTFKRANAKPVRA